jgi:hypothetical protein
VLVLDALYVENIGLQGFLREHVKPLLSKRFPANKYLICGDPAGWAKSQLNEQNVEDIFVAEGFRSVRAPTNDPTKRIGAVEKLLASQVNGSAALLFSDAETSAGMKHLVQAMYGGYKYRRKKDGSYETEPLKDEFSHCFVAGTWVNTPGIGTCIEDLFIGDLVSTPFGPRQVTNTMARTVFELTEVLLDDGTSVNSSSDHPYYTEKGLVPASFLQYNDVLLQQGENIWDDLPNTPSLSSMGNGSTENPAGTTSCSTPPAGIICTGMSGSSTTGRSPMGTKFTTETKTKATMLSAIWSYLQQATTNGFTQLCGTLQKCADAFGLRKPQPQNGTLAPRGLHGTESTVRNHGKTEPLSISSACTATPSSQRLSVPRSGVFAPTPASLPHAARPGSTTSNEHAVSVGALSKLIAMRALKPAPKVVGVRSYPVPNGVLVYDITVEEVHAFYAGGVLVANCSDALQYGVLCIDSGAMAAANGSRKRPVRVASSVGWT